jgi:glyoxylase-like metal-dependent hydrolase (beta-lactamase superfamily II)
VWLHAQTQNPANAQIEVMPVQGNVYMVTSAGGNVTLQVGKEGAVLVDTTLAPLAPAILAEIKKLTNGPLLYIINTHVHPDHVGGNEALTTTSRSARSISWEDGRLVMPPFELSRTRTCSIGCHRRRGRTRQRVCRWMNSSRRSKT